MTDIHESLLTEWANRPHHQNQPFFPDGIIDPERWAKTPRKILFINKEAHDSDDPNSEGFDLRKIIRDVWNGNPTNGAYRVVATWAHAIRQASAKPADPFPRWDQIRQEDQSEALLSSAVINIKKSGGRTTSEYQDLKLYAENDGDLIKRQVDLIDPEIVICGNVWYGLINSLWSDCRKVYDDVFEADKRTFIAFWHPANHAPEQMNYYALAALLQNSKALARYSIS